MITNEDIVTEDPTNQLNAVQINERALALVRHFDGLLESDARSILKRVGVLLGSCAFISAAEVDPDYLRTW